MASFADLPIRRKLSLSFMLSSVVVVLLACLAFLSYEYLAFRREFAASIATIARITADNSTAVIAFRDAEGAQEVLNGLRGEAQIVAASLFDQSGALLATYAGPEGSAVTAFPNQTAGIRFDGGRLICVQPVVEADRWLGTLYVEATLAYVHTRWLAYGWVVLFVALISGGLGWILCVILQRRIARPIVELSATARRISEERDYSTRAVVRGGDELGDLARSFNAMLDRIREGMLEQERAAAEITALNARLEQRVQERTSQLEEANRELESFSYSVSHDLRAPLRHIQGYADMLVRATNGTLTDKANRYLKVITDASGEMGQLIDDLLAFSRMGRASIHEEVVDLGVLVSDVREGLELAIRDREIVWDIAPMPRVLGDASLLKGVFANLLGNAVKFTRTRTPATIGVRSVGQEDGRIVICVSDNGVGFDMAYYDKLFGVFQRLHRVEEFEGTGIGLANVRRIIGRHGGRVWAEGKLDVGAAFFFTLQLAQDG